MTRLATTFDALRAKKQAGLITFIMGGDPSPAHTPELMHALVEAGADVLEIGMPFSDPMADGPIIQAAGLRALEAGTTLEGVLGMVRTFRSKNTHTPVILMGYYNPVYRYGAERFCGDARTAGVDGVIVVDLPPEEEGEFRPHAAKVGVAFIRLVAPTSLDARLPLLLREAEGFVYYISVAGITGAASANVDALKAHIAAIQQASRVPVAVGFGIKTPEQARAVAAAGADAVVVGSALVEAIARAQNPVEAAKNFVRSMKG